MITHNRLEVPTDTKPTSIKKMFHTTDETAEAVSLFNNSILNLSKMKNKTEVYDERQETEDPLERFRDRNFFFFFRILSVLLCLVLGFT
ncbi:hypothetical protein M9Y10_007003 [Tritrichomonas musculus]|uniref:Uncharacterized protein n=1 Tax=Tritrichomonas musculus TaxID=1915356 RepID=A0ABR2J2T3_9EUKA